MTDQARWSSGWSKLRTQVASPSPMSELPAPLRVPAKNGSLPSTMVSERCARRSWSLTKS